MVFGGWPLDRTDFAMKYVSESALIKILDSIACKLYSRVVSKPISLSFSRDLSYK